MSLSDFLTPAAWAIAPDSLEPFFQFLISSSSTETDQAPQASVSSSLPSDEHSAGYSLQSGVAIIEVSGIIHRKAGSFLWLSWEGQDRVRSALASAMADPQASAVLLSFNSPGGVAWGVKELSDYIASQTAKPIYAYADGLCASAAYWLASATGKVYAPRTADVGSIGVVQVHCDRSAANAAKGIRYTYLTSGKWKASGNPDQPLSAAEQSHFQDALARLHAIFREDVSAHMNVDAENPELWGDGQVFLADVALEHGLITGIVTDRDALVARINKEICMDKEQLAKAHPDLYEQIQAEARAEAKAEAEQGFQEALASQAATTNSLVRLVAGEEVATSISALSAAGLTSQQVEALAPMLTGKVPLGASQGTPASGQDGSLSSGDQLGKSEPKASRDEVLEALRVATPGPIDASAQPQNIDPIAAAVDQISSVDV